MTPWVKRRHKSSQVLHFRYIVWRFLDDTFLMIVHWKRCLKDTILLPLLTCVFPSLNIFKKFFSFGLGRFGFVAFAVLIQNNIDSMFNFDIKADFHRLVFSVQTTRKSSRIELKLAMKFDAQISRKLASASWQSNVAQACRQARKTCGFWLVFLFDQCMALSTSCSDVYSNDPRGLSVFIHEKHHRKIVGAIKIAMA